MKGRRPGSKPPVQRNPLPPCPDDIEPIAQAEWERITQEVNLTAADFSILLAYCQSYARWREAEAKLTEEGCVVLCKNGTKKNPRVAVAETYLKQLRAMAGELGFTPGSRGRLDSATGKATEDQSALENFLTT